MSKYHFLLFLLLNALGRSIANHHLNSLNIKISVGMNHNRSGFNRVKFNNCISPRKRTHLITENIYFDNRSIFRKDGIQLKLIDFIYISIRQFHWLTHRGLLINRLLKVTVRTRTRDVRDPCMILFWPDDIANTSTVFQDCEIGTRR